MQTMKLKEQEEESSNIVKTFFENKIFYLTSFLLLFLLSFSTSIFSYAIIFSPVTSNKIFFYASFLVFVLLHMAICSFFSARFSENIFPLSMRILMAFAIPIFPISFALAFLMNKIRKKEPDDEEAKEEEVEAFIEEGTREGIFETEESELIKGIVEFSDTIVREVMTPRTDIVSVEASTPLKEAIKVFAESRHTRLPVYEGQIDNVIGVI
ncbi:MAG: CNNM domain-containing protein, partial [Acidobacteria bacterium]|nr:CNNM domain-containing protein [Acidobacteriota bacterium]